MENVSCVTKKRPTKLTLTNTKTPREVRFRTLFGENQRVRPRSCRGFKTCHHSNANRKPKPPNPDALVCTYSQFTNMRHTRYFSCVLFQQFVVIWVLCKTSEVQYLHDVSHSGAKTTILPTNVGTNVLLSSRSGASSISEQSGKLPRISALYHGFHYSFRAR